MKNGIPGWVVLLGLMLIGFLYVTISDSIQMNNYKASFPFSVDSLQRVVNMNFSFSVNEKTSSLKGGCFVFNLDDGKLIVDKDVNDALNSNISPKTNTVNTVAIIENHEVSSGKYSNGSTGLRFYSTVYLFDCSKNSIVFKGDIWGSEPPSSGYVRSGGKIKGSTVTSTQKASFIYDNLR